MRFPMPFPEKVEAREELCRLRWRRGRTVGSFVVGSISAAYSLQVAGSLPAGGLCRVVGSLASAASHRRQDGPGVEAAVLAVRRENPVWGGRKIAGGPGARACRHRRHRRSRRSCSATAWPMVAPGQRLEALRARRAQRVCGRWTSKAMSRWRQGRLHPLTVVDDHSRYAVVLHAADNERHPTVQNAVQAAFERYGLPEVMLTDNGSPWGDSGEQPLTKFGVWLIEHGVRPGTARPFHPQSHGKNERFNRTLKAELLRAAAPSTTSSRPAGLRSLAASLQPSQAPRRHLAWPCRPIATGPARGPSGQPSSPSTMGPTPPPQRRRRRPPSASETDDGRPPRRWLESTSPYDRPTTMVCSTLVFRHVIIKTINFHQIS